MEIVKNLMDMKLEKNQIVLAGNAELENTAICFKGENNLVFFENGVKIVNSNLVFAGNNSLVYFSKNEYHSYKIHAAIYHHSVLYFGENIYFNNTLHISVDERQNVLIGSGGLFSLDIWIRTGDPHLIYDNSSKKRLNESRSILIGDHVWIGQGCVLLKGSKIGSGSVLGASSVISGKTVESNSIWAGNPAKRSKENIFFLTKACHAFEQRDTDNYRSCKKEDYIYQKDEYVLNFDDLDRQLKEAGTMKEKIDILATLSAEKHKNRFYIACK